MTFVVCFAVLGAGTGLITSHDVEGQGSAEEIAEIDLLDTGLKNSASIIVKTYDSVCSHLEKIKNDRTITSEQTLQIMEIEKKLLALDEEKICIFRNQSNKSKELLSETAKELNSLIAEINRFAAEIAERNHIDIKIRYAIVTEEYLKTEIGHTYRSSPASEAFAVLTLFCSLVGFCTGAFYAVCREAAKQKS